MKTSGGTDCLAAPGYIGPVADVARARVCRHWMRLDLFVGVLALEVVFLSGCANQPGTAATVTGQPAGTVPVPQGMAELYLFNE